MADFSNLPRNTELAKHVVDSQTATEAAKIEGGFLGSFFGIRAGAAYNVAALAVVVGMLVMLGVGIWGEDSTEFGRKEALAITSNIVTLSLGYLFGKSQTKS